MTGESARVRAGGLAGRVFPRSHSPAWIAVGALVSGLSTYVLLAEVAAGVGAARFDGFSLYWAVLIVVSVGGYLPVEQIVARHSAVGAAFATLRGWALRWGAAIAATGTVALLVVVAVADSPGVDVVLAAIFALNLVAVAVQVVVRGAAAGTGRLDVYAATVSTDALARTAGCALLAVLGVPDLAAYALVIAAGCGLSVLVGSVLLGRMPDARSASPATLGREAASLVPAMVSMQLLLNSPILVAFFAAGATGTSAGALLAIGSLVRTAVFVAQAAQAAYVGRIAGLVHRRSEHVQRALTVVIALALALALATTVGAAVLGPTLVRLLYGPDYVTSHLTCLVVGAGVGVFVVATVANDLSVACGRHGQAGLHWSTGVVAAGIAVLVLSDQQARALVPIIVGSVVALALIVVRSGTAGDATPVTDRRSEPAGRSPGSGRRRAR